MTNKNFLMLIALVMISGLSFAGGHCTPDFAAHGTVQAGIEANCWTFVTDSGEVYEIISSKSSMLQDGLTGVVTGELNYAVTTMCMQGMPMAVCDFDADNLLSMVGTLRYEATTGCWLMETGQQTFLMLSDHPGFYVAGAKVKVSGVAATNVRTLCTVDGVIDVLSYTVIGGGGNAKAGGPSNCQAQFVQCRKTCRENPCFVACEDVYDWCIKAQ